jgi:hypothetical protein
MAARARRLSALHCVLRGLGMGIYLVLAWLFKQ